MIGRVLKTLSRAVFPVTCPSCQAVGFDDGGAPAAALCPVCADAIEWIGDARCRACSLPFDGPVEALAEAGWLCPDCRKHPPAWFRGDRPGAVIAACEYGGPAESLVKALKYGDALHVADGMAFAMAAAWALAAPAPVDLLVPVPTDARRLDQRGYNQAAALATPVGAALGLESAPEVLTRRRAATAQAGLDRAARLGNLAEVFAVTATGRKRIVGRAVLVIDDVMTTGATLDAVASALLAGGASRVSGLVFARTPRLLGRRPEKPQGQPEV